MKDRKIFKSKPFNEDVYWERVSRNLGWLGNTEKEQRENQKKLKDVTIGIAGTGGIGGAVAARLSRMGIRNLKLADPDTFDCSNMNRQLGADVKHLGQNKAKVVAEMVYSITEDINIEVFEEGITPESAEEFMNGCDYVMDQMDFYEVKNRYALHRAFRNSSKCKFMFKIPTVAHSTIIFKYTKDSMKIEDVYGLPEMDASDHTPETIKRLMERIMPEVPKYHSKEMLDKWMVENKCMPIFAGCPPLAEGVLVERLALAITGIDKVKEALELPVQPGYALFDSLSWQVKIKKGKWW